MATAEAKVDAATKDDAVVNPDTPVKVDAKVKGDDATENRGKSAATAMATAVDIGANKSYAIPAMEILGFDFLVNRLTQSSSIDFFQRDDGSSEFAAYGEYVLNHRMTAYLLAVLPQGNARQEFSSLFRDSITLGLKIALP